MEEKTKKEKNNTNKNKNSRRRKRGAVQNSSTNGSTFILCSLVALLAVPTVAEESASRGFMDTDISGRGGGGGGGGGSAAHLDGRELGDVNDSWFDSDLQTCLVDEKIWDQFEASYNERLYTTGFDTTKVGV